MKKILAIIPARGGSKSIPKKNIIDLNGKPLIAWTIEASLNSKYISKTLVSSDSDEILEISRAYGAEVIKREEKLSQDDTNTEIVLLDTINRIEEEYDFIILLQATSPLRTNIHIDESIMKFLKSDKKSLISVYELSHSPFKSFTLDKNGNLQGIVNDEYPFMPRQSLPKAYYPNGAIYITKVDEFKKTHRLFSKKSTTFYEMPIDVSIDIDTQNDLSNIKNRII